MLLSQLFVDLLPAAYRKDPDDPLLSMNFILVLPMSSKLEIEVHRLPLWFETPHRPESIEGRSKPPALFWSTTLFALESCQP